MLGAQGRHPGNQAVPEGDGDDAHPLTSSLQRPPLWFLTALHPFSLLPFLRAQHSPVPPCGGELCPLHCSGQTKSQAATLRLPHRGHSEWFRDEYMSQGHTPGSSLSINMLRGGPELLVATLGSTGDSRLRRETTEESRAKDGEGQSPGGSLWKPGSS